MPADASVQSSKPYAHLANDTLMAAAEADAAKLNVNWCQLNWARVSVFRDGC